MGAIRAEMLPVGGGLSAAVGNAHRVWAERRGVVIRLFDEDGAFGCGECSPLPSYSLESLEHVASALRRAIELGIPPVLFHPVRHAQRTSERLLMHSPGAAFALESALLDLAARRRGISVSELLAGFTPGPGVVLVSELLQGDASTWLSQSSERVAKGSRVLKAKIGRDLARELAALETVRAAHPALALRLDANGTLPPDELPALFDRFCAMGVELVEEPIAGPALFALGPLAVPFAIDESLGLDPPAALRSHASSIVVKPAMWGVVAARELAIEAHERGKRVILTHLFDGPWALASTHELALSLPFALSPCGLAPHEALRAYPERSLPRFDAAGGLLDGGRSVPGHGVLPP